MKFELNTNKEIENMSLPNYDFINDVISKQIDNLNKEIEKITIKDLKRKGFEFKNMFEMEKFIQERCKVEDYTGQQERIYFVDNKPFLSHKYKSEIDFENNSATCGSYAYL